VYVDVHVHVSMSICASACGVHVSDDSNDNSLPYIIIEEIQRNKNSMQ
jgi:hypothetical protein